MKRKATLFFILFLFTITSSISVAQSKKEFKIPYQSYKLANGLTVILHTDHSDPMVAVNILFHVGSAREAKGKTGFAHLFEHLMFTDTQFTPNGEFDNILANLGADNNASTGNDATNYYELLPKNGLETALWLESNRMGWLLGNFTQKAFAVQQHVVQNEKRQTSDNVPYGNQSYALDKLMYPENHPYNWQVIGSMEDLRNASLQDVVDFHTKWYSPSNATLVISGDFDVAKTKKLIEKYFSEIESAGPIANIPKMPVTLTETKRAYFEDNFGNAPDLTMSFPTVEEYHPDSYALDFLGQLLGDSKKSPLYKVIVEEKKLAPSVYANNGSQEVAGTFVINARAFPGKNLTDLENAFKEALQRFEKEGFTDKDLQRLKTGIEVRFYNSIQSVLGKAMRLSKYSAFAGSPDFLAQDLKNTLKVTKEDIWRVYNKYIKGKNFVLLSIVPKGKTDLAAPDSKLFKIEEESIADQSVIEDKEVKSKDYTKPSKFDRTKQPAVPADPAVTAPKIWTAKTAGNIKAFGIKYSEVPLVQFSITLDGGMLLDPKKKIGTANLTAQLMNEGTKSKTPIELREAFQDIGATVRVYSGTSTITISGNCLVSKLKPTLALVKEMILEPRWDEKEFALLKQQTIDNLKRNETRPASLANSIFNKLVYGSENILSNSSMGTVKSVETITLDDVKTYYKKYFSPSTAKILVVGDITKDNAVKEFNLLKEWKGDAVKLPEVKIDQSALKAGLYFVDVPNSKQSELRAGHISISATDPDFYKLSVINRRLGGEFISILNNILREQKGYTYGAHSGFSGSKYPGYFIANTSVQSNATLESMQIIKDEITKYRNGVTPETVNMVKNTILRANALANETINAQLNMLSPIAQYNYPFNYVKQNEQIVRKMTPDEYKAITQKHIKPDKMIYLIVGDKATQYDKLKGLGLGDPILLDKEGKPVSK
jgi:zinc protease